MSMDRKAVSDKTGIGCHHLTAGSASAFGLVAVKGLEVRDKVLLDIEQFEMAFMQGMVALLAEPQQSVGKATARPYPLDDQPYGAFLTHRGMRGFGGTNE